MASWRKHDLRTLCVWRWPLLRAHSSMASKRVSAATRGGNNGFFPSHQMTIRQVGDKRHYNYARSQSKQGFASPNHRTCRGRSFFFFLVLVRLLRQRRTPDLLSRFQALSPDLLFRGAFVSSDPSDSELRLLLAVLNCDLVSDLHLAPATTQLHTMVADIESMREMAIFTSGDPESHWHDRFGSLRPPFPFPKSRHIPRSLRVQSSSERAASKASASSLVTGYWLLVVHTLP